MGFAVCVAVWVLSVVPLARDATDGERRGCRCCLPRCGAISLGAAAAIRGVYVLLRQRRQFWSPWLFVLAALLAVMGYAVQTQGTKRLPSHTPVNSRKSNSCPTPDEGMGARRLGKLTVTDHSAYHPTVDDYRVVAQNRATWGEARGLEERLVEIKRVNARLEEAASSAARALGEVSRHWDAVYEAMRRIEERPGEPVC